MIPPLISVVMAVKNVERFLPEAIESILGQSFTDFEFIILDFGSTDNSKSISLGYAAKDPRIKFQEIHSCVLPLARNTGCALAQGRYLAVMDADDVALPHRLAVEVEFLEKNPQVALLGAAVHWIDPVGRTFATQGNPCESEKIKVELLNRCTFWHPTVLMRREAFEAIGGYRETFVYAHDYDLELRMVEHFECANVKDVLLKYRLHTSQITLLKQREQSYCKIAAVASARLRRDRQADPLDGVRTITPDLLLSLGVSQAALQNSVALDCWKWVRNMAAAREYSGALRAATLVLDSDIRLVDRWLIADLLLQVARINWKMGMITTSLLTAGHAIFIRPVLIGRPLKMLGKWIADLNSRWRTGNANWA